MMQLACPSITNKTYFQRVATIGKKNFFQSNNIDFSKQKQVAKEEENQLTDAKKL